MGGLVGGEVDDGEVVALADALADVDVAADGPENQKDLTEGDDVDGSGVVDVAVFGLADAAEVACGGVGECGVGGEDGEGRERGEREEGAGEGDQHKPQEGAAAQARDQLCARAYADLFEDRRDLVGDCAEGAAALGGDLGVGEPLVDQAADLALAAGELGDGEDDFGGGVQARRGCG